MSLSWNYLLIYSRIYHIQVLSLYLYLRVYYMCDVWGKLKICLVVTHQFCHVATKQIRSGTMVFSGSREHQMAHLVS